jgi:ferredoxin-like protein FixX
MDSKQCYDVIIVGGGIMGSTTAFYLTQKDPGLKVAVIERDLAYTRASTTLSMVNARIQFSLKQNVQISQYAFDVLERFEDDMTVAGNRPSIAYHREGNLFLYEAPAVADAKAAMAMQQQLGCRVEWWTPDQIKARYPLYAPAIKGIHLAMKSGMLAAETILDAIAAGNTNRHTLDGYRQRLEASWAGAELREGRNFAQALSMKGPLKWIHLAAQYISKGKGLVDRLPAVDDATTLKPLQPAAPAVSVESEKPAPDDPAMVDKLTGVYLSGTLHREDQPSHVLIHDQRVCVEKCYPAYGCPCTRFCPGDVYEMETAEDGTGIKGIKLNFTNCLHCKTCDIKDPFHNVTWTCPEGGEGPNYKQA